MEAIRTGGWGCLYRWCGAGTSSHGKTNDPYSLLVHGHEGPGRDVFKVMGHRPQFSPGNFIGPGWTWRSFAGARPGLRVLWSCLPQTAPPPTTTLRPRPARQEQSWLSTPLLTEMLCAGESGVCTTHLLTGLEYAECSSCAPLAPSRLVHTHRQVTPTAFFPPFSWPHSTQRGMLSHRTRCCCLRMAAFQKGGRPSQLLKKSNLRFFATLISYLWRLLS